jgi:toxoflavin biosynthesis protein ToxC
MRVISLPQAAVGHSAPITHVDIRPDGRRLATSSYDGSVIVWDLAGPSAPRQVGILRHRRLVNAAAWNPVTHDLIATASADKTVVVWRVESGAEPGIVSMLSRHTDDVNAVAWLPDGRRLVCVSEDGRATLWEGVEGRFLGAVSAHAAHCMAVAVSPAGLIATAGEDGLVTVQPAEPGSDAGSRFSYHCSVEGCAWSPSGQFLAIARDDGRLDVRTPSLELARSIVVSTSAVRSVGWADDEATLVAGAYDGRVHVITGWNDPDREPRMWAWHNPRAWPRSVAVSGTVVAVGSFGSVPHLWDLRAPNVVDDGTATQGPNALAAHEGEIFVGLDSGAVLRLRLGDPGDPRTWSATVRQVTPSPILSLAASADGVFAGSYLGTVLRLTDDSIVESVNLGAPVPSLVYRGGMLVAGTYNGELFALRPSDLVPSRCQRAHDGSVKSLAVVDGERFVSGATDRAVAIGDVDDHRVLWEHGNLVNAVAVLDSAIVASASRDRTVKVGRLEDPAEPRVLMGPDESIKAVGLLGTAEHTVVLGGSYDFGLYGWCVRWGSPAEGPRAGDVVAEFGQAVSTICALDRNTAAVAAWDGQLAIVGVEEGGTARVKAQVAVSDLIAAAGTAEAGRR